MHTAHVISSVMFLGSAALATAGDVRVTCSPGLNIFLDGEFVGVSIPKQDGMYLTGLSAGEHTIMVKTVGFSPKEFSVTVGSSPRQVVVGELLPIRNINQPETTKQDVVGRPVGIIEVTSAPQRCTVEIAGQKIVKQEPIMMIPGIAVGDYDIRFESSGAVLTTNVVVKAGETSRLRADILNNLVETIADDSDNGGSVSPSKTGGSTPKPACIEYWVEVVRTSNPETIESARSNLEEQGFPLYHQKLITIAYDGALPLYKLRVGPIPRENKAKWTANLIKRAGFPAVWVVPEECQ